MTRLAALLTLLLVCSAAPAQAAERTFTKRFGQTMHGDITIAGNILHDCINGQSSANGTCEQARAGTAPNFTNNEFPMQQVDVDSDITTFNSSSATLALPAGAVVRFAGLYWGAAGGGSGVAPDLAARGTVRIDDPAPGGYVPVTAPSVDDLGDPITMDYTAVADVTSLVAAAGGGTYTVADVQSATGLNTYAGWSLVVAYEEPGAQLRNLSVFDGYQFMCACGTGHADVTQTLSGFRTPPVGPVLTRVGVIGYEGEVTPGAPVEGVEIDDTAVDGSPLNPAGDFFNGTITAFGTRVTTKNPDNVGQISSLDADLIQSSGLLPPSSTSAKLDLVASTLDGWYAHVLTFATEVEQPLVELDKAVTDVNGAPARAGDVLEYTVTAANSGNDEAADVVVTDPVPSAVAFVPGSIVASGVGVTDAADADAGELAAGEVVARLGTIAAGAQKSLVFRVTIPADTATGTSIANTATAAYAIPAGAALAASSNAATTPVAAPLPEVTPTPTPSPTTTPEASPTAAVTAEPTVTPTAQPSPTEPTPTAAETIGLPAATKCIKKRRLRIKVLKPTNVVSLTVRIGKGKPKVFTNIPAKPTVFLKRLPVKEFKLKATVLFKGGSTVTRKRVYRACKDTTRKIEKKKGKGRKKKPS